MSDYMFMLESHLSADQARVVAEVQNAAIMQFLCDSLLPLLMCK